MLPLRVLGDYLAAGFEVQITGFGTIRTWRRKQQTAAALSRGDASRRVVEAVGIRFKPGKHLRRLLKLRGCAGGALMGILPRLPRVRWPKAEATSGEAQPSEQS